MTRAVFPNSPTLTAVPGFHRGLELGGQKQAACTARRHRAISDHTAQFQGRFTSAELHPHSRKCFECLDPAVAAEPLEPFAPRYTAIILRLGARCAHIFSIPCPCLAARFLSPVDRRFRPCVRARVPWARWAPEAGNCTPHSGGLSIAAV